VDFLALARMLGALLVVLGMLAGASWAVRRYDLRLPGARGTSPDRRLGIVERLVIDPRHSLMIVRVDGAEHVLLLGQHGTTCLPRQDLTFTTAES
jgi:flagellar protein FliO/FliZ